MASYYFSQNTGSNSTGDGSIGNPWQNFVGKKDGLDSLSPGDTCYFKAGDTWTGTNAVIAVNSSGTPGNPIIFDRYGTGADPIFTGSTPTTGWSLHSGSIYSKAGLFSTTFTIGVDGSQALCATTAVNTALKAGEYKNESGTIFIRLFDNSNPSSHTIYVPTFKVESTNNYAGLFRGVSGRGAYIQFNNMQSWYSPGYGIESNRIGMRVNDCTVLGSGRDGIITQIASTDFRAYRTEVSYCCAGSTGSGGYGQAVTFNSSDNWSVNGNIHDNFMEGIDFLNYVSGADNVHNCGAIYNTVKDNGRAQFSGNSAHGIYVDGANNIFVYGNTVSGNGNTTGTGGDAGGILVGTEHAANIPHDIYIINNFVYNTHRLGINTFNGGREDTIKNLWVINNTVLGYQNNSANRSCSCFELRDFDTTASNWHVKNNIFYSASNTNSRCWNDSDGIAITGSFIDSNYNLFYRSSSSTIIEPGSYTLSTWQTASGEDANSLQTDPKFITVSDSVPDIHLSQIVAGQSSNSPAVDVGLANAFTPPSFVASSGILPDNGIVVGSTRTDGVADDTSGNIDLGYHYFTQSPTPPIPVSSLGSTIRISMVGMAFR